LTVGQAVRRDRPLRRPRPPRAPGQAGTAAGGEIRLGPLEDYIGFHLRRAQDVAFHTFRRRTGDVQLNPGRFALLSIIGCNPGINQTALSRATGRDKSTLTPALRDLAARGWVESERLRGDRRAYALRLTPSGRERLRALNAHAEAHDRELDAIVGARYKPIFIELLDRIVDELERRVAAGGHGAGHPEDGNT
jgi:DNA-binding MarR family transcriptional regulator